MKIKISFFQQNLLKIIKKNFCLNISIFQVNLRGFWGILMNLLDERHSTGTATLNWHCIVTDLPILTAKSTYQNEIEISYTNKISITICTRHFWTKLQWIYSDSNHFQSNHLQTLFDMHAHLQNPASAKRSYKNNYFFRK